MREQELAFAQPGVLEQRCSHVAGDLTGAQVLKLRSHELIVHGWDLGVAVASDRTVPDQLVVWALEELAMPDSVMAAHFNLEAVREESAGGPTERLLKAFGRTVAGSGPGTAT